MKKMVKVILVCTAVLCAIDQIMRFTGPYAIAHIWNDMVLDGNYAALCLLYLKGEVYEPYEIRVPVLEKEWRDNLGNWRFHGSSVDCHRNG